MFLQRAQWGVVALLGMLITLGASCLPGFGGSSSAALGPTGMFRSDDRGERWKEINTLPTAQGNQSLNRLKVYRIFSDPGDPNALYVATRGQGLYYTYDQGETWRTAPDLANRFIYSVAVDYKDKCTIYVTDGTGIFKTTDCTRTWKAVYAHQTPADRLVSVAIDYGNPQLLYAATQNGTVLVSSDAGGSWKTVKRLPFIVESLVSDPLTPRRIYVAGREDGLVRSDDAGITWKDLRETMTKYAEAKTFYRIFVHPSKKDSLFWVSKYGILRSDDAGVTWKEIPLISAPGSVSIYAFGINPANDSELYYTSTILGEDGAPLRSTFYRSLDGGKNWVTKKLPTNTIPVALHVHTAGNGTITLGFTVTD